MLAASWYRHLALAVAAALLSSSAGPAPARADAPPRQERPNVLLITVDDMSCDSVGVFGCPLRDITPHMDALASSGLRFQHAHVQVGNCMPGRNVLLSGRYPHNNGVEGFRPVRNPDYPVMADLMRAAGYFTAIRGKVSHSTPYHPYPGWDLIIEQDAAGRKLHPKDAASYFDSTQQGIAASKRAGKPFFLNVNISDPHKPFYGVTGRGEPFDDPHRPSRVYTADEVPVPGYLFDDPVVRTELAHYYSSVRRADDCLGQVLRALQESGEEDETLVMFLSDHGMPLPFAKTAVYHHSTHTPWMVRWPGKTAASSVDAQHMISAVDFVPTVLDIVGADHPDALDGRSFASLLEGQRQSDRRWVFKEYNENAGGSRQPMRSVQTRRFGYIFNPWADGQRTVRTATTGTQTYRRMKQLAETSPQIAARLQLFDHRVLEELYDYQRDPDALHNLVGDPRYQDQLKELRQTLRSWMESTGDPALEAFDLRDDPAALSAWVEKFAADTDGSRKRGGRGERDKGRRSGNPQSRNAKR